ENRIAIETETSPDYVRRVKWKSDFEKRNGSFGTKLYELARNREYQKNDGGQKPLKLSVNRLLEGLGWTEGAQLKIIRAIRNMDLEQIIEGQVREDLVNAVFSGKYYDATSHNIDYELLSTDINTWPAIARRMVRELNIERYLKFAFENAQKYDLQPQQIGHLLVYSDEGMFKDKTNGYNYVGLAKHTGLPLDKVVEILKHK
ncbi:MAG: hypothetical protein QXH80_02325, partial [Candidatus Nanoarchaeia archaeon]